MFHILITIGGLDLPFGLDLAFRGHDLKKSIYKCLSFFVNISKSMMIQWLKFGPLVVNDLLNISNGLDHDL